VAHFEQRRFLDTVKQRFPAFFVSSEILEVGSLDINGSVRALFDAPSRYVGIDLAEGPGVDVVCGGQEYLGSDGEFDVTISAECFEHNPFWKATFSNMVRLCREGGLVVFTCATIGRYEHGTTRSFPHASPLTVALGWDYYHNLTEVDFRHAFDLNWLFSDYEFSVNHSSSDLYFWGIRDAFVTGQISTPVE